MKNKTIHYKYYVGIDVSKLTIDVTVLDPSSNEMKHETFNNNQKGFSKMYNWLKKFIDFDIKHVLFCYEHTGVYTRQLGQYLNSKSAQVWIESSLQIKKSLGLNRGKNDKIDSMRIAEYSYRFCDKAKIERFDDNGLQKLKDLLAARERLLKTLFILSTSVKELKKQDKEQGLEIELLNASALRGVKQSISEIESSIIELIASDLQLKQLYDLLLSIPGVGMVLAVKLIVYTKAFTMFENVRQLACYCGVAPFEWRSGTSVKGATGVSKFANMDLKSTLHLASLSAIQHNPELKKYYNRKVEEGKSKMSVINAVRNKLLHRIVAVVNRKTPYVTLVQG